MWDLSEDEQKGNENNFRWLGPDSKTLSKYTSGFY